MVCHVLHYRVPWTGDDWDGGSCANVTEEEIIRNEQDQYEAVIDETLEDSRGYATSSNIRRASLTDVFRAKVSLFFVFILCNYDLLILTVSINFFFLYVLLYIIGSRTTWIVSRCWSI